MNKTETKRYMVAPTQQRVCQNIPIIDATFEGNKNPTVISQALKLIFSLRNGPIPIEVTVKIHDSSTLELIIKDQM